MYNSICIKFQILPNFDIWILMMNAKKLVLVLFEDDDAQVERTIQTLKDMLRACLNWL